MFQLYFAGAQTDLIDSHIYDLGANRLFSYLSEKRNVDKYIELIKTNKTNSKLIVDSGAFSAWTRGSTIDVDAYINWLNERSDYLEAAGQLDVIPGDRRNGATKQQTREAAAVTWDNYLYMRERLKNPDLILYTYHIGEPIEFLDHALQWRDRDGNKIKYMAFGGLVGKTRQVRKEFLSNCYHNILNSSNPDIKVHAFGMTDYFLCNSFPIYSADSTTWIIQGSQGRLMDESGNYIIISEQQESNPEHIMNLHPDVRDKFIKVVESMGFSYDVLKQDYKSRLLFNIQMMNSRFSNIDNEHKKVSKISLFSLVK